MEDRTHNGVKFRILNIFDEYTRECLAVRVDRRLTHKDILEVLTDLFIESCAQVHIRSDNGSEFTAKRVRQYLSRLAIKPFILEPGIPGKMAILNHLMARCGMSYWQERFSIQLRKLKSSLSNGGGITIRSDHTAHWVTTPQHQRLSSLLLHNFSLLV